MAVAHLLGEELASRIESSVNNSVERHDGGVVWVRPAQLETVARFLRDDSELDFQFLNSISAVDFVEHFEVVYHLTSMRRQHCAVVKTRVVGREDLSLPSVYHLWRGADFQEREVWDLMGIRFEFEAHGTAPGKEIQHTCVVDAISQERHTRVSHGFGRGPHAPRRREEVSPCPPASDDSHVTSWVRPLPRHNLRRRIHEPRR